ncbi:hypothetical protein CBS101457_006008 [Exobasidium rhododendri]|nr:hypothetical protein CBS101457_006008 [Exobasidium rhododendri]
MGNNFADPERPGYSIKECQFLKLSQPLLASGQETQYFNFQLPHFIDLNDAMRKKLSLHRANSVIRHHLPPTFSEESHSYVQKLFIPWKEPSKARVDYHLKATITWSSKAGMGRLLGSSREKTFREPIFVIPTALGERGQTLLPKYSGLRSKHWHREPGRISDGVGGACSCFSTSRVKLRLLGDTMMTLEKPLLFCLEFNNNILTSTQTHIAVNLVRIVSKKSWLGRREVERRDHSSFTSLLRVTASEDQMDEEATDSINSAYYDTSERHLNGSICLLDSSTKLGPLSPAFTFAGLMIEYRLQFNISSGDTRISFLTPPIILETEPEAVPPIYTSTVTS